MPFVVSKIACYHVTVADQTRDGAAVLSLLAAAGVDLLAFRADPRAEGGTRFTLLPKDGAPLVRGARQAGLAVDGPRPALFVTGGEEPGALAGIYRKLAKAAIPLREGAGIADINGGYGVVLGVAPEDADAAMAALQS